MTTISISIAGSVPTNVTLTETPGLRYPVPKGVVVATVSFDRTDVLRGIALDGPDAGKFGISGTFPNYKIVAAMTLASPSYNVGVAYLPTGSTIKLVFAPPVVDPPPVTGIPQYPTLLAGYKFRPSWQVAGVDYYVGVPEGLSLKDPATIKVSGVNVGKSVVTITGDNVVLDSYDFSLAGGWAVQVQGKNARILNSNFVVGSNGNAPILGATSAVNLTVANCTIDGARNADVGGLIEMRGGGIVTVHSCWLKNAGGDMIQFHTGGRAATADIQNNLVENAGMAKGAHGDYTEFLDGPYTAVIKYNTTVQNGGTTQGFMVEPDIGSSKGTVVSGEISNNVFTCKGGGLNVYTGVTVADIVNIFTVHDNYFDPANTLLGLTIGGVRGGPGDGNSKSIYTNNINMVTGEILQD